MLQAAFAGESLEQALLRRTRGQPLAHVLGQVEFCKVTLSIGPGVFIPRPRAEMLLRAAVGWLGAASQARVLDLGCGCGSLAAALKQRLPGCEVHASDVDERSLEFARRNGDRWGFAVHNSDWLKSIPGRFSLILAYLPHVPEAALSTLDQDYLEAEGVAKVLGGTDGLDSLRALLPDLSLHGGLMTLLEAEQVELARGLAAPFGWGLKVLAADGCDRVILLIPNELPGNYFPALRDSK